MLSCKNRHTFLPQNTMDMMREAEESITQDELFGKVSGDLTPPSTPLFAASSSAGAGRDISTPPAPATSLSPTASAEATAPAPTGAGAPATAADDADIQAAMAAEQAAAATQLDDFADHFEDEEAIAAEMDMGGWGEDF